MHPLLFSTFLLPTIIKCTSLVDQTISDLDQSDPRLATFIKDKLLEPPPIFPENVEDMNMEAPSQFQTVNNGFSAGWIHSALQAQYGQPLALEELFEPLFKSDNKTKRFFIEAGAHDGIGGSNTLRFELNPLWSGLLVEPNPQSYELLRSRGRNAWTLPSCLSTKPQPEIVEFDSAGLLGGIINQDIEKKPGDGGGSENRETLKMQCVPLYSVLLALDNPRVDFMSLDIEGADMQVLKTIPYDKVDISVLMIEVEHLGEIFEGDNDTLRQFLHEKGYVFYRRLNIDDIYIKQSFMNQLLKLKNESNEI